MLAAADELGLHNQAVRRRMKRLESIAQHPPPPHKSPDPTSTLGDDRMARIRDKLVKHRQRNGYRELPTIPGIQSLSINIRYIEGGRKRFVELVQNAVLHDHADAAKWLYVYGDLTIRERDVVNYDDICAASGVTPSKLMAAIVETEMNFCRDVSDVIRAVAKPKIVHTLVQSALDWKGPNPEVSERDRMRFLQADGTLPAPKGTIIQVAANAQAAASAALDPSVPSFRDDMQALRTAVEALPPPSAE